MTARAVHWHEGMFLRPQQFQAAERHAHEVLARNCRWDLHHGWGLHRVEWEPEALATSRFALRTLEARFRDGSTLVLPEDGSLPALDLKAPLAKSNRVTIYVAIPQLRLGRANTGTGEGARYATDLQEVEDENSGVNPQPVSVRLPNVRLLTDADELTGFDTLPLARIEKSARAEAVPQLDESYIPPLLCCEAWPTLQVGILRTIFDRLGKKMEVLAGQVTSRGITLDSHGQGDARIIGQLARLNEAHALLSNVGFVDGIHPLPAYLELCRLVGQLSIFGRSARPPELPRFDHDDLGGCFWKVKQHIDGLLNEVEEPAYEERAFIGAGLRMQVAIEPKWLEPAYVMFLGARSPLGSEEIVRLLTQAGRLDMKVGSSERVDQIFSKGAAGLKFNPSPRPPRALPSANDLTYFQIDRDSTPAEWQYVEKSLSLAIRFNEKLIEGNIQGERELKLKIKTGGGQTATIQVTLYVVPQSAVG
jgi:type VI secretion system protein ImpJ